MSENKTKAVQRSLAKLRREGWLATVVERWIPPRGKMKFGIRQDAFGFGDILACRSEPDKTTALVQAFPLARWKDHMQKILGPLLPETDYFDEHEYVAAAEIIESAQRWREADNVIILHGWAFRPKDGMRGFPKTWQCRVKVLREL